MSTTAVPGNSLFEKSPSQAAARSSVLRPIEPRHPVAKTPESDAIFSAVELERFRQEDAEAGRRICTILTTLFTVCVLLASGVIAWTFLYAVQG